MFDLRGHITLVTGSSPSLNSRWSAHAGAHIVLTGRGAAPGEPHQAQLADWGIPRRSLSWMLRRPAAVERLSQGALAEAGAKDHDRWLTARRILERKLEGKRRNSRMGALIELVMARPIVNAALIARALEITPRAAQTLVAELNLRELTGRGRYRAWGIL
jgi:hypothetical protein